MIISLQCGGTHGIGAENGNGAEFAGEGQQPVVLQQHQGFPGRFQIQGTVRRAVQQVMVHLQGSRRFIQAQAEALGHDADAGFVDILLCDEASLQSFGKIHIDKAEVHIAAMLQRQGG